MSQILIINLLVEETIRCTTLMCRDRGIRRMLTEVKEDLHANRTTPTDKKIQMR